MQTQASRADKAHDRDASNTDRDDDRRERELAIIEEALDGGRVADHIGTDDCRQLRERVDAGRFPKAVAEDADVPWDRASVRKHAYGRCRHDADTVGPASTPPTEHAAAGRAPKVTRADCDAMRGRSQRRDPESAIADAMGVGRATANRHIRGNCKTHADEDGESV